MKGDFQLVDWREVGASIGVSFTIGVLKFLHTVQRGRSFRWFNAFFDPVMAVMGGMLVWALMEITPIPDMAQAALTSLGAWGGLRTVHWLEMRYLGGSRAADQE